MKLTRLLIILLALRISTQPAAASSIVLNEIMPHPSPGNDWVELYNPTADSIDLTRWTLTDSTSTMKTLSGSITANGFITFDLSNRLNNSGDSIYLKDSTGNEIDNYSYNSDPGLNQSIGRSPDGNNWTILTSSSKGSTNGEPAPTPTSTPTPTPTPIPAPSKTPAPSPTPKKTANPTQSTTQSPTSTPHSTPTPTPRSTTIPTRIKSKVTGTASVAAAIAVSSRASASSSPTVDIKDQKQFNPVVLAGIVLILIGIGSIGYIYRTRR